MAGLELLFRCVSDSITSAQDALLSFLHWEIVKSGYKCLGTGDEPRDGEKKSELLPAGWSGSRDVYILRYRSDDDSCSLLLKAFPVDSALILNLMDSTTGKITDLTVNVSDYVDEDNLQTFESVFKNTDELMKKIKSLLPSGKEEPPAKTEKEREKESSSDPLRIPHRTPPTGHPPHWPDPMAPFAAGGADLDPFSGRAGGMIVDPLRAGFPRSGFDPSSGVLPPGAVPPGARFDPFSSVGRYRPGPDPDHMPPPGFDDMFM